MIVAQSFIVLQQARHDAGYNPGHHLEAEDAKARVGLANSAFEAWERTRNSEAAREYLFALLFKEKERP
jgi:hypothetical protein